MKARVHKLWTEALRSGQYMQGTGSLHQRGGHDHADRFCCLGVLCDLALKEGVVKRVKYDEAIYAYDDDGSHLPISVQKWAGLTSGNVFFSTEPGRSVSAVTLNDDRKVSFPVIADWIDKYLPAEEEEVAVP